MDTALSFPLAMFPHDYSAYLLYGHFYTYFFLTNVSLLSSPIRIAVILHVNTFFREAPCLQSRAGQGRSLSRWE